MVLRDGAAFDKVCAEMVDEVQKHNDVVKPKCDQLSLNSSTKCDVIGGVCSTGTGLEGILKRYFAESFAENVVSLRSHDSNYDRADAWIGRGKGFVSGHRNIRNIRAGKDSSVDPRNTL